MRRIVLDADAFLGWFTPTGDRRMRDEYEAGELVIAVASGFGVQVLEGAARHGWDADRLQRLTPLLGRLGFEQREPASDELARWLSRGLGAASAATAAVAAGLGAPLVSGDPELRRVAEALLQRD